MTPGPPSFSRRTLALSPVLLILREARASGSRRTPSFAEIHGSERTRSLLEDAFSILSGRPDGNTFSRIILPDKSGRKFLLNDNVWWKYTDTQCNFHGTYGWRPFFDEEYRTADRNTWQEPFRNQVTTELQAYFQKVEGAPKAPPLGWLPFSYDPLGQAPFPMRRPECSVVFYYSNSFVDPKTKKVREGLDHSENTDYPLMNCITATDSLLWERDAVAARQYLPKMDTYVEALLKQFQDPSGLLRVGTQGSQIEYAHGGWRYPGHTHVYLWKVFRNLQAVARFIGRHDLVDKYGEREEKLAAKIPLFLEAGKWFVGGLKDPAGLQRLGTGRLDHSPSSYFEVWHNVNAIVLHLADEPIAAAVVEKIASIPALTANHLTLVNYPARPAEEFDPGHPPTAPGAHVNGGWFWMCAAGALYSYTRTRRHDLLDRLGELLSDHHQHFSIDCYNNYGADKASQWKERGRDSYSVTCAGSFGMLFRALLGLEVTADAITVSPRVPRECERIKTTAPVYYARKKLRFDIRNRGGEILWARLNGRSYRNHDQDSIRLPWQVLQADNLLEIDLDGSGQR